MYASLIADARRDYYLAKEDFKSAMEGFGEGSEFKLLGPKHDALLNAEKMVRYYEQQPDIYRAFKLGIEIDPEKYEEDVECPIFCAIGRVSVAHRFLRSDRCRIWPQGEPGAKRLAPLAAKQWMPAKPQVLVIGIPARSAA